MSDSSNRPKREWSASDSTVDSEIPPAIACAHCGQSTCDGCSSEEAAYRRTPPSPSKLIWEQPHLSLHTRLLETAKASARAPEDTFLHMEFGSVFSAFQFAVVCELWAVISFSLPWALGFFLLFPRMSRHMLTTPSVVFLATSILFLLILAVIVIHMWWGASLEWGIAYAGKKAKMRAGLRFGLYACGWDLVTSPAGYVLVALRDGWHEAWDCFRAGASVPRKAMLTYLGTAREIPQPKRKQVTWTAIWITSIGLLLPVLLGLASLFYWLLSS